MNITLFFSYGISLRDWYDKGLLQREIVLYRELSKYHNISFLTYGDESDYEYKQLIGNIKLFPIYSIIKKPKNRVFQLFQTALIPRQLTHLLKHTDLLKTNQMWGGWVAVIAKIIYKKPLIVRCGYEQYDFAIKAGKSLYYRIFIYFTSMLTYRLANRIHVATEEDKQFVIDNFLASASKVYVHPNWIDIAKYKPLPETKKKNAVLYVGRLNRQKNIPLLLRALSNTDIQLDIVGVGEMRGELSYMANKLNVHVNFIGSISNDRMNELYNLYKVYVLCSHYEGNPKTLLEAMASGAAVIGTDVPGIRNVIQHEEDGLLVPDDKVLLREAIMHLLADEKIGEKFGKNARNKIIENNSLQVEVKKELAAYDQFMVSCA